MISGNVLMCSAVMGIAASFARTDAAGGSDSTTGTAASIALLCAIMFFFSVGAGPFTLVVVNEMIPYQARSKVVAASVLGNRVASGTVALTFLSLKNAVSVPTAFYMCAPAACPPASHPPERSLCSACLYIPKSSCTLTILHARMECTSKGMEGLGLL